MTVLFETVEVFSDSTTELVLRMEQAIPETDQHMVIKGARKEKDFSQNGSLSIRKQKNIIRAPSTYIDELPARETGRDGESRSRLKAQDVGGGEVSRDFGKREGAESYSSCRPRTPYPCPPPLPYHPYGGSANVNGAPFDGMFFKNYGVNPFVDTEDDHLSTFAVDVDDASYVLTRSYLDRGYLPPEDAIRIEEFVNHFDYGYESPRRGPFEIYIEGAPSYFGRNCQLLRIGIKGKNVNRCQRQPATLVFLIDVSGSMGRENRLELVKDALIYLVDQLDPRDRIGIVVYQTHAREILEPISVRCRQEIYRAIENLHSGGSTNLDQGLELAYRMAQRNFAEGQINRVILCSDGVANVGITSAEELLSCTERFKNMGITLTAIGVGMGNHNDALLEQLADKGNGHYAYVDGLEEARRVFIEKLTGTLQVIARDVKIQVDFNPGVVRSYRLLGYENRDVDDRKFRDDFEDGGEIGAGHQVTALYEIKFHEHRRVGNIGRIYVRYQDPDRYEADEVRRDITGSVFGRRFENASLQFQLAAAAAEFAEILKKSYWARGSSLQDVSAVVSRVSRMLTASDVNEFLDLIRRADRTHGELAEREW